MVYTLVYFYCFLFFKEIPLLLGLFSWWSIRLVQSNKQAKLIKGQILGSFPSFPSVCLFLFQDCFESLLSILHWSWTTLVLGVEELRGLKGFQFTATLLDLERLRFVGTCCLRLLRVYICEIFPISGIASPLLFKGC